jgi:hypothetical protein
MKKRILGLLVLLPAALGVPPGRAEDASRSWAEAARRTHAKFTGRAGTFAQFGDSITVTMAFWTPLQSERRNAPPALEQAFRRVDAYLRPECWRDWKGPEFGSDGGKTIDWADEQVGDWLRVLNPEVAHIMFGTNDLLTMEPDEYRTKLRRVVRRCLDNGTVVILSTIPPRHGLEEKAGQFARAAREIARVLAVPLIDYRAEILQRPPDDWDGAADRFREYEDYEVPTLISRDGVHPSFPERHRHDYSEAGLTRSGYTLRNYLTLVKYAEVIDVLPVQPARGAAPARRATGRVAERRRAHEW